MSDERETFAERRPDGAHDGEIVDELAARSRAALATLGDPDHGPDFWSRLDRTFADEPQLRLTPRAAIRPITQPPLAPGERPGGSIGRSSHSRRRRWRRIAFWTVVTVVVVLAVVSALDDRADTRTGGPAGDSPAQASAGEGPVDDGTDAVRPPEPGSVRIEPDVPLEPSGVGPLQVGMTLRDVGATGVGTSVNRSTFEGSGGTCFDVKVHGSGDLTLRFRSPDPAVGVDDPMDGELAAVGIRTAHGADQPTTERAVADTGIQLGTPEADVLRAYAGNLIDTPNPYDGGHVYVAPVGDGTGIAFGTDGSVVTSIVVGLQEVIPSVLGCT